MSNLAPEAPAAPSIDKVASEMLNSSQIQSPATITNSLTSSFSLGASVRSSYDIEDIDTNWTMRWRSPRP